MYRYNFGWIADRLLFFKKCCFVLIYKMGPKKARKNVNMRKIVPDTHERRERVSGGRETTDRGEGGSQAEETPQS